MWESFSCVYDWCYMEWRFVNICSSNCSRAIRNVATLVVEIKTAYQNEATQTDGIAERGWKNILLLLPHSSNCLRMCINWKKFQISRHSYTTSIHVSASQLWKQNFKHFYKVVPICTIYFHIETLCILFACDTCMFHVI
jgi:hypothetical protein